MADLMAQFENAAGDDYRLNSGSNLRSLVQGATGVDFEEMRRSMTPPTTPGPRLPRGPR
jgi:hypothetical protein